MRLNEFNLYWAKGMSFERYYDLVSDLLEKGQSTGSIQSEALTEYSKLNLSRMKRLRKTYTPSAKAKDFFQSISQNFKALVLTEGWCGDAAQNLPILDKLFALNDQLQMKLLLRDDNLDLMDQFLTNGGRSIPKLLLFNPETETIEFTWGPRPEPAQNMVMDNKLNGALSNEELKIQLQKWYNTSGPTSIEGEWINSGISS